MTRVLYICSAGHSGSTLLDLLLGSQSQSASLGEITHFPKNLALDTDCACGEPISRCELWQQVISHLESTQRFADLHANPYQLNLGFIEASSVIDHAQQTRWRMAYRKLLYGLSVGYLSSGNRLLLPAFKHLQSLAQNKMEFLNAIAEVGGFDYLIDSSKHYLEAIALYQAFPEEVRIVELVRDGRAVFYSGLKRKMSAQESLDAWKKTCTRAIPLLAKHVRPEHKLRVHYEKLTRAPGAALEEICRFANMKFEPSMLDFQKHDHHMTNGNRMRFSSNSEIRYDESWKLGLGAEQLAFFNDQAANLNRSLGYK